MKINLPAFSISSQFLMFEWARPNDENILSTPAAEVTAVSN